MRIDWATGRRRESRHSCEIGDWNLVKSVTSIWKRMVRQTKVYILDPIIPGQGFYTEETTLFPLGRNGNNLNAFQQGTANLLRIHMDSCNRLLCTYEKLSSDMERGL